MRALTRILVVDDDEDMCFAYTELLRMDGWSVSSADIGAAAMSAARCSKPAMIVIHLWVSDPRGFDIVRALRVQRCRGRSLVVGLTASSGVEQARVAGCDAAIVKPIDALAFVGAVHGVHAFLGGQGEKEEGPGRLRGVPPLEGLVADRGPVRLFHRVHQAIGFVEQRLLEL